MNGFTPDDGAERMTRLDEIRARVGKQETMVAEIRAAFSQPRPTGTEKSWREALAQILDRWGEAQEVNTYLLTLVDTLTADLDAARAERDEVRTDLGLVKHELEAVRDVARKLDDRQSEFDHLKAALREIDQRMGCNHTDMGEPESTARCVSHTLRELDDQIDQLRAERDDCKELARINSELLATERAQVATHEAEVARLREALEEVSIWGHRRDEPSVVAIADEALTPGAGAGDLDTVIQARVDSARPTNALLDMEIGM